VDKGTKLKISKLFLGGHFEKTVPQKVPMNLRFAVVKIHCTSKFFVAVKEISHPQPQCSNHSHIPGQLLHQD